MKIVIIIPTYNERENIEKMIEELYSFLPKPTRKQANGYQTWKKTEINGKKSPMM